MDGKLANTCRTADFERLWRDLSTGPNDEDNFDDVDLNTGFNDVESAMNRSPHRGRVFVEAKPSDAPMYIKTEAVEEEEESFGNSRAKFQLYRGILLLLILGFPVVVVGLVLGRLVLLEGNWEESNTSRTTAIPSLSPVAPSVALTKNELSEFISVPHGTTSQPSIAPSRKTEEPFEGDEDSVPTMNSSTPHLDNGFTEQETALPPSNPPTTFSTADTSEVNEAMNEASERDTSINIAEPSPTTVLSPPPSVVGLLSPSKEEGSEEEPHSSESSSANPSTILSSAGQIADAVQESTYGNRSSSPSAPPTTTQPVVAMLAPSAAPSTWGDNSSDVPTVVPTNSFVAERPSQNPSQSSRTAQPSITATSSQPSSAQPSESPSLRISILSGAPSEVPSRSVPTIEPTLADPSGMPSFAPSRGNVTTIAPSSAPSQTPSETSSVLPTVLQSKSPSVFPSLAPTTLAPTFSPSTVAPTPHPPSQAPTFYVLPNSTALGF